MFVLIAITIEFHMCLRRIVYGFYCFVRILRDAQQTSGKVSSGIRQRLGVTQIILENTSFPVPYEPLNGLDITVNKISGPLYRAA